MIRYTLRLFGFPIVSIDRSVYEFVDEGEDAARIEGGSAHNFERDVDPVSPEDRYQWEWEDKKRFGFS